MKIEPSPVFELAIWIIVPIVMVFGYGLYALFMCVVFGVKV